MNTVELRDKADKLESEIRELIKEFYERQNGCRLSINIKPEVTYLTNGHTLLTSTNVEVLCII